MADTGVDIEEDKALTKNSKRSSKQRDSSPTETACPSKPSTRTSIGQLRGSLPNPKMPTIRADIEIAASPATVRAVFLDFPRFGEWHDLATVTSATPGKETGHNMVPGDTIVSKVKGMTIKQTFQENTPQKLRWIGPWLGLLTGEHIYEWNPSETIPGGTRMVQSELFTGPLAFFMAPSWSGGKQTIQLFAEMNQAMKKRAENVERANQTAQQPGQ